MKKILVVLMLVCAAPVALAGDASGVAERVASWEAAYNEGNSDAVAAHYTADAVRLQPFGEALEGHDAIRANIETFRAGGAVGLKLEVLEAESQGNMAWAHGTWKLMDADGNVLDHGPWMNVSKKVGNEWKIARDIWNSRLPRE